MKPKVGPFSCKQRKQRGTNRRDLTKDGRRKTRGENKEVEMARRNLGFYMWRSQSLHSLRHPLSILRQPQPAPTGYNRSLKDEGFQSLPRLCRNITTNGTTKYPIEFSYGNPIRTTPSHTVYNGKFNGRDVSFFLLSRIDDRDSWIKDSQSFLSDHFLRVFCDFAGPNGILLCTERVVCSLSDYFAGKTLLESGNIHALHSTIIPVVRDLVRIVLDFKSIGQHSNISVDSLYWTGSRVVIVFRRFNEDLVTVDDYALEKTLFSLFGGFIPRCLLDFFICLRHKIPHDYLLHNHYGLMSSEARFSWRSFVVRQLLEGTSRSSNTKDLRARWTLREWRIYSRKVVVPDWKNALQSYAGGTTVEQSRWWSQRADCPVQYFIMARNIGTHRTHDCGASVLDHALLTTFPEHENLMLVCLHDIFGLAFLFVRV